MRENERIKGRERKERNISFVFRSKASLFFEMSYMHPLTTSLYFVGPSLPSLLSVSLPPLFLFLSLPSPSLSLSFFLSLSNINFALKIPLYISLFFEKQERLSYFWDRRYHIAQYITMVICVRVMKSGYLHISLVPEIT